MDIFIQVLLKDIALLKKLKLKVMIILILIIKLFVKNCNKTIH